MKLRDPSWFSLFFTALIAGSKSSSKRVLPLANRCLTVPEVSRSMLVGVSGYEFGLSREVTSRDSHAIKVSEVKMLQNPGMVREVYVSSEA